MSFKKCLVGGAILLMSILVACSGEQSVDGKVKLQIVEKIKELETSEYDLYYFKIDYDTYLLQVDGIVSDTYLEAESKRVIFGYDGVNYTSKELKGMPQDEWNKHKEYMLRLIEQIGLDGQKETIQFSEPYDSEQENEVFIYTSHMKEVQDKPFTKTNKKNILNLIEGQWLVTSVEFDRFTYGSDRTEEEIKSQLTEMEYQMHEDQPVEYLDDTIVLQGVAED